MKPFPQDHLILLSGATGFLGAKLLKYLIDKRKAVLCLSRYPNSTQLPHNEFVRWCTWENISELEKYSGTHTITFIHLATHYGRKNQDINEVFNANYTLPKKVIKKISNLAKCDVLTADTFFGKNGREPSYLSDYVASKRKLANWCKHYATISNTTFINMRFEHIFGPVDSREKFVEQVLSQIEMNCPEIKLTHGRQKRDFLYINDAISAIDIISKRLKKLPFSEVEIGTGCSISVRKFVEELTDVFNGSRRSLKFGALRTPFDEIMESYANNDALLSLGWKPEWVLRDALLDMKSIRAKFGEAS